MNAIFLFFSFFLFCKYNRSAHKGKKCILVGRHFHQFQINHCAPSPNTSFFSTFWFILPPAFPCRVPVESHLYGNKIKNEATGNTPNTENCQEVSPNTWEKDETPFASQNCESCPRWPLLPGSRRCRCFICMRNCFLQIPERSHDHAIILPGWWGLLPVSTDKRHLGVWRSGLACRTHRLSVASQSERRWGFFFPRSWPLPNFRPILTSVSTAA